MPRSLAALLCAALLGVLIVGTARSTSCAATLEWRGETYVGLGEGAAAGVSARRRIGTGIVPPCGEATRGCAAADPATETLLQIDGVPPELAVVGADDFGVYAARGYVGADPRHPLHDLLYGKRQRMRERRGWTCGAPETQPATVGEESVHVQSDAGRVWLESRTKFVGLERNGVAYLEEGQRVLVRTLTCRNERGRTRLVAARIEAVAEG